MRNLQSPEEIDRWHRDEDPWGYETHPDDLQRKLALLSEIPSRRYRSVLDVGCGQGFVTRDLPGEEVVGVDLSENAIEFARRRASERHTYLCCDLFELPRRLAGRAFDLIVITGVLYPQYVGRAHTLVYRVVDRLLARDGILVSVHVNAWYSARFPYAVLTEYCYPYREHHHRIEVYAK